MSFDLNIGDPTPSQPTPSPKKEFLDDLNPHDIALVFSSFSKDRRKLIIPVGFPQAGKSLLLSSLMYYAVKGANTPFRLFQEEDFPFDKGRIAANQMIKYFDEGSLYDPTQEGTLDLLGVTIQPNDPKSPPVKLGFLDLSGEDLKRIKINEGASFTDKINAVFNGIKIDETEVIFLLITPFEPARLDNESRQDAHDREDALHYDFLNFLHVSQPDILKNAQFVVVASQWDRNPDPNEDIESFIQSKRPSLYNLVKKTQVTWGDYSIGKLLESTVEGIKMQTIVRIDYENPLRLWKMLYRLTTRKDLIRKSWWDNLFGN